MDVRTDVWINEWMDIHMNERIYTKEWTNESTNRQINERIDKSTLNKRRNEWTNIINAMAFSPIYTLTFLALDTKRFNSTIVNFSPPFLIKTGGHCLLCSCASNVC